MRNNSWRCGNSNKSNSFSSGSSNKIKSLRSGNSDKMHRRYTYNKSWTKYKRHNRHKRIKCKHLDNPKGNRLRSLRLIYHTGPPSQQRLRYQGRIRIQPLRISQC